MLSSYRFGGKGFQSNNFRHQRSIKSLFQEAWQIS